jgi:hypothetical protein
MSLAVYIEADNTLTMSTLEQALFMAGACEVKVANNNLEAVFASGLTLHADHAVADSRIYAEDTRGIVFDVARRCSIRIKGPEPDGHSQLGDLERLAQSIMQACPAWFVISFQFETTLYWRDKAGLHRQDDETAGTSSMRA